MFKGLNKEYKGKFATVVSNGDGIKMYHSDLPLTFKVAGVSVTRGEFFKGDIADILQYFKDNGGVSLSILKMLDISKNYDLDEEDVVTLQTNLPKVNVIYNV